MSARVLLFTGKGGVGKTSVAAATGLRCADAGLRTLVLSTDPAHSLADALGEDLGSQPSPVVPGLWGQQLDAAERLEDVWGDIQSYLVRVLDWVGVDAIEAEELAVLPGLEELFALSDIKVFADSGEWDVVVVDCAPTAETVRFLSLPDVLAWYMDRVFPTTRALTAAVRPLLGAVTSLPIAGDAVFDAVGRLYGRLEGVRALLTDSSRCTVRLVVNPERIVVSEARRMATYLALFGYRVDAVVANRLLPDAVSDPWFKAWKEAHAEHLAAIEEGFAPLPVLRADLAQDELVGVERLREFASVLYGDADAASVLHAEEPMRVVATDEGYELSLRLPFADRDDLELGSVRDELLVRVGPYRRAIVLPDSLRRRDVLGASIEESRLVVRFGGRTDG